MKETYTRHALIRHLIQHTQ